MLTLSRKVGEELMIGDNIKVVVRRIAGNRVLLGVNAPGDVHIVRGELLSFLNEFQDNLEAMSNEIQCGFSTPR